MPLQNLRGRGLHGRPPLARHAARSRASGVAMAGALLGLLLGAAGARAGDGASAHDMPTAAASQPAPRNELERLQYIGRAQPDVAVTGLQAYIAALPVEDPRHLEALLELGANYVAQNRAEQVEEVAARIDSLSDRLSLARPAAMLLRGQWMQRHGDVGKAERQIIEASALLPANPPDYLRLRVLMSTAFVKNRGGHYDEAMASYNQALKLVDQSAPTWMRVDLRSAISNVLREAGQPDRAIEVTREEMRLAAASGDEYGLSTAYTMRAIHDSENGGDTNAVLADWRAALEHARLGGSKHQIIVGTANIADYYLEHGDFQTAYALSQTALPLALSTHDLTAQSVAFANTGLALIGMRRKDEGLPLVRQAMSIDESSGSAANVAELTRELGGYLERAGYLEDALAAYHQYRQLSDELRQQDRQRALLELQEGFANDNRQHELDMLGREGRLKDEEIRHHQLQIRQWTAAGVVSLLLLAVVAVLARRLRLRNQLLSVSNEQLRLQAEIDPLTGLSNRHHLQAVMAQRGGKALEGTLYLLDVDYFKHINDRCGHAGGDSVLVEIARRLRATVRDDDLIVRWGGEEFLVLVRPLPPQEAEALAQRLLCALADVPVLHDGSPVPVSASIGFGRFPLPSSVPQPELAVGWERAISLVDAAMYLAKAHGRNGACSLRRVDAADSAALAQVIEQLETAAADGRVELQFQHGPAVVRDGDGTVVAHAPASAAPRAPAPGAEVAS